LAREGIRLFLRNVAKGVCLFCILVFGLAVTRGKTRMHLPQAEVMAGMATAIYLARLQTRKRSRHIPRAVRQAVITRDLKGEKFDSTKHQIDHVWPFSKGGSHTADNLRVIDRKSNLQKRAERPRMREMW
jgi:hypothetical protein